MVELAGLPSRSDLDGRSLLPLLSDPEAGWEHPAITTYFVNEYSIRDERWRYIRYIDGSEELYDHQADPQEWHNLAADRDHARVKAEMARHIPQNPAPFVETSYPLSPHQLAPARSVEDYLRRRVGDRQPPAANR